MIPVHFSCVIKLQGAQKILIGYEINHSCGFNLLATNKEWCWSWNSSTLATSCEELTHWKRLWCWEGLRAGGEGDDRGWDGWMASRTRWTWVWVNSRSWWWTGRPGVLRFMGSQRVGHDWATKLNWTEPLSFPKILKRKRFYFFPCHQASEMEPWEIHLKHRKLKTMMK